MTSFSSESDLIGPVSLYFYKNGGVIFREIRLGFCRADLVVFTSKQTVIAVELKLADWKKAIIQARNYQLGSDYVYVAFPDKKQRLIEKKALGQLKKHGIGLLFVQPETKKVTEFLKPVRSTKTFGTISIQELKRKKESKRHMLRWF